MEVAGAHTSALTPPSAGHTQTFAKARLRFVRFAHLKPMETGAKVADAIAVSFFIAPSCDANRLMFAVRRARRKVGPLVRHSGFQMRSFVCGGAATNKSPPAMG